MHIALEITEIKKRLKELEETVEYLKRKELVKERMTAVRKARKKK